MLKSTTTADRHHIVALHQQGHSYNQIARFTGWSFETVRRICRCFKRDGQTALEPRRRGRPPTGPLSTFDHKVRLAVLRIKCQHPAWGPDIVRAELTLRSWASPCRLPSPSSIYAYWCRFGDRLIVKQRHKQISRAQVTKPARAVVHGCWQLDVDEAIELPGCGRAHLLSIVDHHTGLKINARLFAVNEHELPYKVTWPQYRQALRQAFEPWGLPRRVRTDRERVLVAHENYPFPMPFTLWLAGLGIEHEIIERVTQNGCVERSHRTWIGRLQGYGPLGSLWQWQQVVDYERWRMNAVLPSRGRRCRRRPPLLVYPEARERRRWYRQADELALFDEKRVEQYLAQGQWVRRVNSHGQFTLGGQVFNLGKHNGKNWTELTYVPELGLAARIRPRETVVKVFELAGLSAEELTGLRQGV